MGNKKYKGVAASVGILVAALIWVGTHMLPNRSIASADANTIPTQLEASEENVSAEKVRYTIFEQKARTVESNRNAEDFFNKAISGVVINQWRADTVPNVRACGAEWRDSETFKALCLSLYDTMIVEVDISATGAAKKILVPAALKKPVSIGDRVVVITGSFDSIHETGLLPSISTDVNEMPHENQSG